VDVVGRGLGSYEDRLAALLLPANGIFRRENDLAGRGAGAALEPLARDGDALVGIDARVEELVERLRVDHADGASPIDESFFKPDRAAIFTAASAVRFALRVCSMKSFPRSTVKLQVLHVAIMALQTRGDLYELRVDLG